MKFTDEHEWLTLDGNVATVGITYHAVSQLGDLVFVELPAVGAKLQKGAVAAVVESIKTASEVYAPLSGEVVEINDAIAEESAIINADPFGRGWLYKMRLENVSDFEGLLDETAYTKLIG